MAQATQPASPVCTLDPLNFFPAVSQPSPLLLKLWLSPVARREKLRPLWLLLTNMAVPRDPLPAPERTPWPFASTNSHPSLGPFLGPIASMRVTCFSPALTREWERGCPGRATYASLWAFISLSLQRRSETSLEKATEADVAWPMPNARLAAEAHSGWGEGRGCSRGGSE